MNPYPTIARIANALAELPAFVKAAPENQPDRE
jgi:maleylpyruvate isomerase